MMLTIGTERALRLTGATTSAGVVALTAVAMLSACGKSATAPSPATRLIEAGWSFGFCQGPCAGTLEVEGDDLSYRVTGRTGTEVLARGHGELTSPGVSRLNALLSALPSDLLETYGCPDCADGGAAYVLLRRDAATLRSAYEYPSPPRELAALDAFLREVMDALGHCRSSSQLHAATGCTPVPE